MTKTENIKNLILCGMVEKALIIASKFHDRSDETKAYKRAVTAKKNPSFYKQIGKDPDEIYKNGLALIQSKFT